MPVMQSYLRLSFFTFLYILHLFKKWSIICACSTRIKRKARVLFDLYPNHMPNMFLPVPQHLQRWWPRCVLRAVGQSPAAVCDLSSHQGYLAFQVWDVKKKWKNKVKCDGLQNSANIELYLFSDKIRVALLA